MKIFVGYGYNGRDEWIPKLIFPLIRAFDDEVVTGEDLQGETISDAVREKIAESDGMIGFLTRRGEPDANNRWKTHRWVIEELATAAAKPNPRLAEVREEGVDEQGGIVGDRQRIEYRESARDHCVVEVAKVIGKWHKRRAVMLHLLPEDCVRELMPLHGKQDLRCSYQLLLDGEARPETPARIVPITGGLFLKAKDVPPQALVSVHVEYHGMHWRSDYENLDSPGIHLIKE